MKSISNLLLKRVLSVYLVVTVFIFAAQVAVQYHEVRRDVIAELDMLHGSFGRSLSLVLWNFDREQLTTTLEGMLNMPSVSRVAALMPDGRMVREVTKGGDAPRSGLFAAGDYTSRQRIYYREGGRTEDLGWLEIQSNGEVIVRRLMTGVVATAVAALLKTALLVFLIHLFFQRILSRPLLRIAQTAASIDPKNPPVNPLPVRQPMQDELDVISLSINSLATEVRDTVEALHLLNQDLEAEVAQRTAQLQTTRESLAQSEKSLGGLVAGIAHEINTPVGLGLTGTSHFKYMVEKLETRYRAGELDEAAFERFLKDSGELARSIFLSLEKAAALVRSFKLVAVDQSSETMREFDFGPYLDDILLTHHPLLRKARLTTVVHCPPKLMITSYPGAWSQILSNMINNAIVHAFTPEQEGARIDITVREDGPDITLAFRDNGKGMTDAVARQVYAPFFTTNRQGGGSGLGLHIVYNLVTQQLQGAIHVETLPGQGTTFTVRAPRVLRHGGSAAEQKD